MYLVPESSVFRPFLFPLCTVRPLAISLTYHFCVMTAQNPHAGPLSGATGLRSLYGLASSFPLSCIRWTNGYLWPCTFHRLYRGVHTSPMVILSTWHSGYPGPLVFKASFCLDGSAFPLSRLKITELPGNTYSSQLLTYKQLPCPMDLNYDFKKSIPPFSSHCCYPSLYSHYFFLFYFLNLNNCNTFLTGPCLSLYQLQYRSTEIESYHFLPRTFQNKMQAYYPPWGNSNVSCKVISLTIKPNQYLSCFCPSHTSSHAPLPQLFCKPAFLSIHSTPTPFFFLLKSCAHLRNATSLYNCILFPSVAVTVSSTWRSPTITSSNLPHSSSDT